MNELHPEIHNWSFLNERIEAGNYLRKSASISPRRISGLRFVLVFLPRSRPFAVEL
jgi:hypothetical protein